MQHVLRAGPVHRTAGQSLHRLRVLGRRPLPVLSRQSARNGDAIVTESAPYTLRLMWPIFDTDLNVPMNVLAAIAREDVPTLSAQTRAQIVGPGRWRIDDSCNVPGSGRITPNVLIFEAPAIGIPPRCYQAPA